MPDLTPERDTVTERSTLFKVSAVALFLVIWLVTYKFFNNWNAQPERAIHLTRPCDLWPRVIQPWTAWIYVLGGYPIVLLPLMFSFGTWVRLKQVLIAYAVSSVIGFTC